VARRRKQFRAWGLVLLAAIVLSVMNERWLASAGLAVALLFYLLAVRRTRCRVETEKGRPCSWTARGFVGSCKVHVGLKRGLPAVIRFSTFGLPRLMWERPNLPPASRRPASAVVGSGQVGVPDPPERNGQETVMLWLAAGGVVVALASFLRDLFAG
jgi:hypothetical protein